MYLYSDHFYLTLMKCYTTLCVQEKNKLIPKIAADTYEIHVFQSGTYWAQ